MHSRSPDQTLLHRTLREQLEPFLARARDRERPAPRFVEQELRAFLRCGILAHGFLRLHCDACGHDRLVPFSCKRRGFLRTAFQRFRRATAEDKATPEQVEEIQRKVTAALRDGRVTPAEIRDLTAELMKAFP